MRRLFLSRVIPCALLAWSALAQQAFQWPEIGQEQKPWTRWWWLGSAVDRENLTRELQDLNRAGFGGVEITAIYGAHGAEDRFISYLSPHWVEMLGHTISEAHRLGLGVDLPPGSGWRTGGLFVTPEYASTALRLQRYEINGGDEWQGDFAGQRIQAVVAYPESGEPVNLTSSLAADGRIRWKAPAGKWVIYAVNGSLSGEKVKRPAPGGEGPAIDPYSRAAAQAFLTVFAERLKPIPRGGVRTFFHDSFEYQGDWSLDLLDEFAKRRRYRLENHLPALDGKRDPAIVGRVWSDYRETLSDMLRENFLGTLKSWSRERGGRSRNQAHGSPGNLLDLYAASDIPETENFGPLEGTDADPLISKFSSSAAHVTGQRLVSSETFTWLGEHFNVSLGMMKAAADRVFVAGVNHLFYHGTAYSPKGAEWPGWLFYASTEANSRNPIWRDLPALNQYIARCQSLLQSGEPDNDVLIYWPYYDIIDSTRRRFQQLAVHTPAWFHQQPLGKLAMRLWLGGYGFDYISDRQLREATYQDGTIRTPGSRYATIVVPQARLMPVDTLEKLLELTRAGATVVFESSLPESVPGLHDWQAREAKLKEMEASIRWNAAGASEEAAIGRGRLFRGTDTPAMLARTGAVKEELASLPGMLLLRRARAGGHIYFIANTSGEARDTWVPLGRSFGSVVWMDPMTGRTGLAAVRDNTGKIEVRLQLSPGESAFLATYGNAVTGPAWSYGDPAGEAVELNGEWRVRFLEGGPVLPPPSMVTKLESWTALAGEEGRRFAGTARYELHFDQPANAPDYLLDLGRLESSARVSLNNRQLGTVFRPSPRLRTGALKPKDNVLVVDVTNLAANRIRDLDRRGVKWRIFYDINLVNIHYRPFDASIWPIRDSGLLGPVRLQPLAAR